MNSKENGLRQFLFKGGLAPILSKQNYFSLSDIKNFLPIRYKELKQPTLNRYLVELVRSGSLFNAGRGWYSSLSDPFKLDPTPVADAIKAIEKHYPLLRFSCWSTDQVKSFMNHLLNEFVTFVFTEREAMSSLYELLRDSGYDAWLNPRGKDLGRFIVRKKTIVVRPMITEAPNHGHFSVIEKLLVDFYVEAEELSLLDRSEYWQVQGRIIGNGRVDIATMIRYAGRRKLNPIEVFPWLKSINGTF